LSKPVPSAVALAVSSLLKKTLLLAVEMTNRPNEACFKTRVQTDGKLQACVSVSIYFIQF